MLKLAVNELSAEVNLNTGSSPLLVKEGRVDRLREAALQGLTQEEQKQMAHTLPVSRARDEDIIASLHSHAEGRWERLNSLPYYLPGSSLRGAWRSHLERQLRGLDLTPKVCDPLLEAEGEWQGCSKALETARKRTTARPYSLACPVCRLFGSTEQGGRIWIGDGARLGQGGVPFGSVEQRDHVSIDRRTGGPARNRLFRELVLVNSRWRVTIRLRNFELFHVYLLGYLFCDLEHERVPVGGGKARGYGRMRLASGSVTLTQYSVEQPPDTWKGIGEAAGLGERIRAEYQIREWQNPPEFGEGQWSQEAPWRWKRTMSWEALKSLAVQSRDEAGQYMQECMALAERVPPAPAVDAGG